MNQSKTIIAIATPIGKSALAIIRISGLEAFEIVSRCLINKEKFINAAANYVSLYTIIDPKTNNPLDEVTAIKYSEPKSFTGENLVEIICHGGPRIVEEISEALLTSGASPAGRGEFSKRAYTNGKIDLLKAEAIRGIIESTGDMNLACARKLYKNEKNDADEWRKKLIEICAQIEADIEFNEVEEIVRKKDKNKEIINELICLLEKEIKKREKINNVENCIQIVIAGPTNAGKSSLFNLLLEKERSIVHDEPGTTRDILRERVMICGYQAMLIDSAGIRETKNEIEQEGIRRSKAALKSAGIIIWVTGANESFSNEEIDEIRSLDGKELICVINKTDLIEGKRKKETLKEIKINALEVSIKERKNIEKIIDKIEEYIKRIYGQIEIPDILLNKRQEEIGISLKEQLVCALNSWDSVEIAAHHLKKGIDLFEELYGKIDNEEILNTIFNSFCIGK
jgi:tRNA modification GTPase